MKTTKLSLHIALQKHYERSERMELLIEKIQKNIDLCPLELDLITKITAICNRVKMGADLIDSMIDIIEKDISGFENEKLKSEENNT